VKSHRKNYRKASGSEIAHKKKNPRQTTKNARNARGVLGGAGKRAKETGPPIHQGNDVNPEREGRNWEEKDKPPSKSRKPRQWNALKKNSSRKPEKRRETNKMERIKKGGRANLGCANQTKKNYLKKGHQKATCKHKKKREIDTPERHGSSVKATEKDRQRQNKERS